MMFIGMALFAGVVSAAGNAGFVMLAAKDPSTWEPIDDGAWGKLMYKAGPKPMFIFNGKGLVVGQEYALINYFDPWRAELQCEILGTGVATHGGTIKIQGDTADFAGKIWLVPTKDLTGTQFNAWNPNEYLFETALI